MTTTWEFQKLPDFFDSEKTCLEAERLAINTNPRYPSFTQTHFTAGDIDQFNTYRSPTNGQVSIPLIPLHENVFQNRSFPLWEKYKNVEAETVTNTFSYLFHKFKKGVFVKIQNNELRVFLPFSKKNFVNEWGKQIRVDPQYKDIHVFLHHIQQMEGRKFKPHTVNRFPDTWYANNCLVRYEFPVGEGDSNNTNMADMLKVLCKERTVPDIEFFINRRDFPILKRDATEPYNHMFDTSKLPLLSHSYEKYIPILSMVGQENYADLPIPTGDDWARVTRSEGKYFERSASRSFSLTPTPWSQRIPTAVFRGASTGCSVTIETNPRLKATYLSSITPQEDGFPLLDAGITKWNLRPRKIEGYKYLQTIEIDNLPFSLSKPLTPQEQTRYKYTLNIDGNVSAFRLSLEMSSGCCLLLVDSPYHLWFKPDLQPYVHYVPVKQDLSDLLEKIRWCRAHDALCENIAQKATEYANQYLTKKGILDYLQKLVIDLKNHMGLYFYNYITPLDIQYTEKTKWLQTKRWKKLKKRDLISTIPYERKHNILQGIEWVFSYITLPDGKEFFDNKLTRVKTITVGGVVCVVKSGLDETRKKEVTHEAFVILACLNNLAKYIPHFVYGMKYEDNQLVLEYIEGLSLREYLMSSHFNINEYLLILTQLALALQIAQNKCGFIHYDLTPWNILLRKVPPTTLAYTINNTTYTLKTTLIPIIIDMGRSHVIHNHTHYGLINPYKMTTIQDIITLLTTSLYIITDRKNIPPEEVTTILKVANFLARTQYRKYPFYPRGKDGLGELRYFLRTAKKYTELITSPKYELEAKTPMDFVQYIGLPLETSNPISTKIYGSARLVLDYSFSQDKQQAEKKLGKRIRSIKDLPLNILYGYYVIQYLGDTIETTLQENKEEYRKCKQALHKLKQKLDTQPLTPLQFKAFPPPLTFKYDEYTFQQTKKIDEYLNVKTNTININQYDDIFELKEWADFVFHYKGEFELPLEIKKFYQKEWNKYPVNELRYKLLWANRNTFHKITKEVVQQDKKYLTDNTLHETILTKLT